MGVCDGATRSGVSAAFIDLVARLSSAGVHSLLDASICTIGSACVTG